MEKVVLQTGLDSVKQIFLLNGRGVVFVDDADYRFLSRYRWGILRDGHHNNKSSKHPCTDYARTRINGKQVLMHRLLLPGADHIDHKNGNGLDNRRENLRECTFQQNMRNRRGWAASGLRGVNRRGPHRYEASIRINKKNIFLGSFRSAEQAAMAYNDRATLEYGEFARLNNI